MGVANSLVEPRAVHADRPERARESIYHYPVVAHHRPGHVDAGKFDRRLGLGWLGGV